LPDLVKRCIASSKLVTLARVTAFVEPKDGDDTVEDVTAIAEEDGEDDEDDEDDVTRNEVDVTGDEDDVNSDEDDDTGEENDVTADDEDVVAFDFDIFLILNGDFSDSLLLMRSL
jgi:hypothetical protein